MIGGNYRWTRMLYCFSFHYDSHSHRYSQVITDTGTSWIGCPTDVFNAMVKNTNAKLSPLIGQVRWKLSARLLYIGMRICMFGSVVRVNKRHIRYAEGVIFCIFVWEKNISANVCFSVDRPMRHLLPGYDLQDWRNRVPHSRLWIRAGRKFRRTISIIGISAWNWFNKY